MTLTSTCTESPGSSVSNSVICRGRRLGALASLAPAFVVGTSRFSVVVDDGHLAVTMEIAAALTKLRWRMIDLPR